jgi:DNA-binding winged helix-turn-helix (wHTH) protein
MTEPLPSRRYRFGVFEADARTGELRRQGLRVKLHAQPLLTREEISRELWPDGTFVDYEHGVNSAVNRIREALGDKASSPTFIETLARRGYRFVAPVERVMPKGEGRGSDGLAGGGAIEPAGSAAVPEGFLDRVLSGPEDLPNSPHYVVTTLFLLLQAMYLGFYVGALANLVEIRELMAPLPHSSEMLTVLIVTAATLIPVRAFLLCAVLFRAPGLRGKFLTLWPFLLVLDVLWALSPFLLLHHINYGLALACMALLVYSPFAQRSLILMGARDRGAR